MCKFMQSCWRLVGDESYLDEHTDSNLSQMQVQISNPPLLGWYVEQVKSEVLFWTHKKFTPLIWPRCFSNQLPSTSSQIPQKKPVMRHFCPRKGGSSVLERKNALGWWTGQAWEDRVVRVYSAKFANWRNDKHCTALHSSAFQNISQQCMKKVMGGSLP